MEINDLIRLAAKADLEGNFRVADRLTEKIETMSREAGFNFGPAFKALIQGIPGVVTGVRKSDPIPAGFEFFNGMHIPKANITAVKAAASEARAAAKAAKGAGVGGGNNAGGGGGASAVGVEGGIHINGLTGATGARGLRGLRGLAGAAGPAGRAGAWWPGLVAGLLGGAIGAGGVAAWLTSKGADDVVVRDIENHLGRLPQFQMMTRRTDSGDLTGSKAIQAQNFVDTNSTNPRLKNQRDWYNFALQQSGGDQNFANNVISLVKATPQMPSSIGGGPNI
jgi:hypothetical protein